MLDDHFRAGTKQKELGKLKKWLEYSRFKGVTVMEYVKCSACKENIYSSAQTELIFYPFIKFLKVNKMCFYWCNDSRIQSTNYKKNAECEQLFKWYL